VHKTVDGTRKKANPFSTLDNDSLRYKAVVSPSRYCFRGNVKSFGKILDGQNVIIGSCRALVH
jgi:hypothetical protein